jgi:hypothetical protein
VIGEAVFGLLNVCIRNVTRSLPAGTVTDEGAVATRIPASSNRHPSVVRVTVRLLGVERIS